MEENNIRPERVTGPHIDRDINVGRSSTPGVQTENEREVEIRRNLVMGRDLETHGSHRLHHTNTDGAHLLSWGSITCGLTTSLTMSVLLGALFLGLGFDKSYGVFGGLNQGQVGVGAMLAMAIGTFIGAYLSGYLAHFNSKLHGFMVGVTSIMVPLLISVVGAFGTASAATSNNTPTNVAHSIRYSMAVAAENAWQVFLVGTTIIALATVAGYLGHKHTDNMRSLRANRQQDRDVDRLNTY
jgi:hypothetical protein